MRLIFANCWRIFLFLTYFSISFLKKPIQTNICRSNPFGRAGQRGVTETLSCQMHWRDKVPRWHASERLEKVCQHIFHVLSLSRHSRPPRLVTPIHVARQSVFVTPRCPARLKGLDLQIFVRMGYFENKIEK